jgi:hypothetical protein
MALNLLCHWMRMRLPANQWHLALIVFLRSARSRILHCISADIVPLPMYNFGKHRRIDFMLGTEGVHPLIRNAGYLAFDNGISSGYRRGLFVDLNFEALLGSIGAIAPPVARGIRSEDQPAVD